MSVAAATPAFGAEAHMDEPNDVLTVYYYGDDASGGSPRPSDITVDMPYASAVRIKDTGVDAYAGRGWTAPYGCQKSWFVENAVACSDSRGQSIRHLYANLGDRNSHNDRFRLDPSTFSTMTVSVMAGDGNDTIDLRGGSQDDAVWCGAGIDWAWSDPGDYTHGCENSVVASGLTSGAAAVAWSDGLSLFYRGAAMDLIHERLDTYGRWTRESLGGVLTSDPAVVSSGTGRLHVFVRGTDGALWYRSMDNRPWGPWASLGGQLWTDSAPAVAARQDGSLVVFVRGTDNQLYSQRSQPLYPYQPWSGWRPHGGVLTSEPAAVTSGLYHIDVFVRGTDGSLYQKVFDDFAGESAWMWLGGQLTSAPAAASRTPGQWPGELGTVDVFATGTDGALYRRAFVPGEGWRAWTSLGGNDHLASAPDATAGPGGYGVFIRDTDGHLQRLAWAE